MRLGFDELSDATALEVIGRRGPDAQELRTYGDVTLGHSRLAIIDLDERSNQPMTRGRCHITFNGEIYNYKSLKIELTKRGHRFTTDSDTEVVLSAYQEWGRLCSKHLFGMFAFAIYDEETQVIFFSRDRFGQKPLLFSKNDNGFVIGSDRRQIQQNHDWKYNEKSVESFFRYKYVPGNDTIAADIHRLCPGHYGEYHLSTQNLEIHSFYTLPPRTENKTSTKKDIDELDTLLEQVVRERMVADVPLGVFLSGGVDSSLIAHYAAKSTADKLQTYSIGFEDQDFDESPFAKEVARRIGSEHTTLYVNSESLRDELPNLISAFDEPFADPSALPMLALTRMAKEHVTVALSGDGADEFFLGYNRYLPDSYRWKRTLSQFPCPTNRLLPTHPKTKLLKSLLKANTNMVRFDVILQDSKIFDTYRLNDTSLVSLNESQFNQPNANGSYDLDILTYLPNDINVKVDRTSMFSSLEVRSPFLDHRVAEYARNFSQDELIRGNQSKTPLRYLANLHLGKSLMDRKKSGFSVPLASWLRGSWRELFFDTVTDDFIESLGFVDTKRLKNHITNHMTGQSNCQALLWNLMIFALWERENQSL